MPHALRLNAFSTYLVIAVLAWLWVPTDATAQDSFSKGHSVILLMGLPGDQDSEDLYTSEANRLLDLFDQPDSLPKDVTVLSDLTGLSTASRKYPLTTGSNHRDAFLKVAASLKPDQLSNLVFIMIGHGGVLASSQVFHVPGPRLQTGDIAQLTQQLTSGSYCIYLFPGSGIFAAGGKSTDCTFLTSDGAEPFTQDPVAAGVLLNLLEKQRGPLAPLAHQLGIQVRQWYDSRNQTREEEPTLWVGEQPQSLLPPPADGSAAAATPTPTPSNSTDPNAAMPTPSPEEVWNNIHPVHPQDYPNSDAVMLMDHTTMILDDSSTTRTESEQFIQILKPSGKRFGDFQMSFSPPNDDLDIQACEVRLPSGDIEQLGDSDIHTGMATGEAEEAANIQHKMFSMPHAEPGSILHIRQVRTEKRLEWPHFAETVPLTTDMPVVDRSITVKIPASSAFHYRFLFCDSQDPHVSQTQYGTSYLWQWNNIPTWVPEPLSPEDSEPKLALSTFPDFADFTDWYRRIIQGSDQLTPELAALAKDLTKDCKTDQDKVDAITRFVTNFRYIAIPLGVSSIRPHFAAEVCAHRYGDCKDKANLVDTLVRSLGFKASLVLVPRFSQAYPDLPGYGFNHAIAQVQVGDKTEWIDSTDDICRTGFLPPGDCGRRVLVVDAHEKTLTELPQADAEKNQLQLHLDVSWPDPTQPHPTVVGDMNTTGIADYLCRAVAKESIAGRNNQPWLEEYLGSCSGHFILETEQSSDPDDMETNLTSQIKGHWLGLTSQLPADQQLIRLPGLIPREWIQALSLRTLPMEINHGYPLKLAETITIQLPTNASHVTLPTNSQDSNALDSWSITWSQTDPNRIQASMLFTVAQPMMLAKDEPSQFQGSLSRFMDALQNGAVFTNGK